jgi:branched-chain amino acid transport system permease protein
MTILGGIGTVIGPVVGAFLLTGVFELTNMWLPEIHPIISGAFIILVTLFLPRGVMGIGTRIDRRPRRRKALISGEKVSHSFDHERR